MDDNDRAVRGELDRRIAVIEDEEREAPRPAFPKADLVVLALVVVLSVLVGLIAGIV